MNHGVVCFLCCCLAFPAIGIGATLEGVVTDGVTDAALGGVKVVCQIGEKTLETFTDGDGAYRFPDLEQGRQVALQFQKIGFVPWPDETSLKLLSSTNRLNRLLYARDEEAEYYRDFGDYLASLQALSGFKSKSEFVEGLGLPKRAERIVLSRLGGSDSALQAEEIETVRKACRAMLAKELEGAEFEDIQVLERGDEIVIRTTARDARGALTTLECVATKAEDGAWSPAIRQPGESGN